MRYKTVVKKLKLSEKDFDEIKKAVADAEAKTTGEIAIAVTPESAHYSFWELLYANIIAAIVTVLALPLSDKILAAYQSVYWQHTPAWILPAVYLTSYFIVVLLCFYIVNIPFLDRLIIPKNVQKCSVTYRAFRYFTESGVYETMEHSGILIFVSYLEHQVRIIADTGIAQKISQDLWNLIADELAEEISKGNAAQAFKNAVSKCGELLAENFPAKEENPNEIPDGLVILGGKEWD